MYDKNRFAVAQLFQRSTINPKWGINNKIIYKKQAYLTDAQLIKDDSLR